MSDIPVKEQATIPEVEKKEEEKWVWEPYNHLNNVTDEQLVLATELIEQGYITEVTVNEKTHKATIKKKYNLACKGSTYKDISKIKILEKENTFSFWVSTEPLDVCDFCTCGETVCPMRLAGFILYAKENGLYETYVEERERHKQEIEGNKDDIKSPFSFDPGTSEILKHLHEPLYELAKELLDKDSVTVKYNLNDEGKMVSIIRNDICFKFNRNMSPVIFSSFGDKSFGDESETIFMGKPYLKNRTFKPFPFCGDCRMPVCPYAVALYMKSLQARGLSDAIEEDRKYYSEHPEEIYYGAGNFDYVLPESSINAIKKTIETVPSEILNLAFELLDNKKLALTGKKTAPDEKGRSYFCLDYSFDANEASGVRTVEEFREIASKKDTRSDFAIGGFNLYSGISVGTEIIRLAGGIEYLRRTGVDFSDALGRRQTIVEDFVETAKNIKGLNKILSLINNEKANSLYCIIQGKPGEERDKLIKQIASALTIKDKVLSADYCNDTFQAMQEKLTRHTTVPGGYDLLTTGYIYQGFHQNVLHVLTDLGDYVRDYKLYTEGNKGETRERAYKHIGKELVSYKDNTYIIILSESEAETKSFLDLDTKYKFMYGENLIQIDDMSFTDIYNSYINALSSELVNKIKDTDKFKADFIDYLTFNMRFLPFGNAELARYLANYSNIEGEPVLPPSIYNSRKTKNSLDGIVGMEAIKKQVTDFEKFVTFKKKAEGVGLNLSAGNLHMQFLGNPGTGKTTIARIISDILYDIGILKENKLIEVERKDLVAQYTGQTAIKTADVVKKAMGGILFIDEAYSLYQGPGDSFGREAIATLMKAMEDYKDDLVVIFAGYDKEMAEFYKSNSGIQSRIGYTFHFDNYTSDELIDIFMLNIKKQGFECEEGVRPLLKEVFEAYCRRKNFGNGRFVKKVEQQTIINHAQNAGSQNINNEQDIKLITAKDIPSPNDFATKISSSQRQELQLDDLIGLKPVKEEIAAMKTKFAFEQVAKTKGIKPMRENNHMLFLGNPGTGKTTVARILVRELYEAGVISENKMIECSRKDLVGEYLGQTAPRTQDVIDRAIGGVLFIDEAYSLCNKNGVNDPYGAEAVATLIKAMEDDRDDFVVIMAGYAKEMSEFLETNSGIASRIGYTFRFEDYDADALTEIFRKKASLMNFSIDEGILPDIKDIMQYFSSVPNFGNGRFVDRLVQMVYQNHAQNYIDFPDNGKISIISAEDIPTINEIIEHLPDGENMINPDDIKEEQNTRTAYHELGHAVVCTELFPDNPIERITISAEGNGTFGYVRHSGYGVSNKTATELLKQICVGMAGIAAEEVFLGEYANGGTSDLQKATDIAWNMLAKYGMSSHGFVVKEKTDAEIEKETNKLLKKEFERAKDIIVQNKEAIERAKTSLLKNKAITHEELLKELKK